MALYQLRNDSNIVIDKLVTTVNAHHNRVSMHGLRIELLKQQCASISIPLETIELSEKPSMEEYGNIMNRAIAQYRAEGFDHCGFGDIFLEDLRDYREAQLRPLGITCSFPLWKQDTKSLIREFLGLGFKAIVICSHAEKLDESFVGREIDETFIDDLPPDVDPCGENGEFHTFCYDGPIFRTPVKFTKGEKVLRQYEIATRENTQSVGFWFLDLIPA